MARFYNADAIKTLAGQLRLLASKLEDQLVRFPADSEIYLNDSMAIEGLARLSKMYRELVNKLDDMEAGIYRPRVAERKPGKCTRPTRRKTKRG